MTTLEKRLPSSIDSNVSHLYLPYCPAYLDEYVHAEPFLQTSWLLGVLLLGILGCYFFPFLVRKKVIAIFKTLRTARTDSAASSRSGYGSISSEDAGEIQKDRIEPLAIVGMSVRFPQEATSVESFWNMLLKKRSAMTEFPEDRLALESFHNVNPKDKHHHFPMRGAHFITGNIGAFDAPFFSVSPTEAAEMDPQQRTFLETVYRALENAGLPLEQVVGSNTSVFTGLASDDFKGLFYRDPNYHGPYAGTGSAPNMMANRVNWFYNFTGASISLDTACSSTMVAFHLACQGLRAHESDMAIIGSGNLIFSPDYQIALSNLSMLSPDSRSYSFDYRANGYARGEGFAALVVKRLSDALHNGDNIRAVVRGTGSNQDGRTPSITQPSKISQESLILKTYRNAGLTTDATRYFEAHGTGTQVGDPIEAAAIGAVFRSHRTQSDPLYVGAVKSNIGHLEGASGMAGLIKAILVIENGIIPANCGFERANPEIDTQGLNLKFPVETTPWPKKGLRRASVNSFGFGGSNAHAILDDAYTYLRSQNLDGNHCTVPTDDSNLVSAPEVPDGTMLKATSNAVSFLNGPPLKLLIFSAMDDGGLKRVSTAFDRHLSESDSRTNEDAYLDRLTYTLNERRTMMAWRSFALATSLADLRDSGMELSKPCRSIAQHRLAFVFTGQGAQWATMGKELLAYPVFSESLKQATNYMKTLGCSWDLLDELLKDALQSRINDPVLSQPLSTSLQIGIVELLRSFGVSPVAVVGHSSGEIAAAYCIGGLSRESAWRVAYYRGVLADSTKSSSSPLGMLAVAVSEEDIQEYLVRLRLQFSDLNVSVGCINSPRSITLTGSIAQLAALQQLLDEEGLFARFLQVNVAYHSAYMQCIVPEYLDRMGILSQDTRCSPKKVPLMVSSVTGSIVYPEELTCGDYWAKNLTSQVKFSEAVSRICNPPENQAKTVVHDLLEIGPHSALQGPIKDTIGAMLSDNKIQYHSVLNRKSSAAKSLLEAMGKIFVRGHEVSLPAVNRLDSLYSKHLQPLANLPEYPFDHSHVYWRESRVSRGHRFRKQPRNIFLGVPSWDWSPLEARWRNFIRLQELPWLEDHKIDGFVLYPAAGMLVMAVEAAKQLSDDKETITGYTIKDAVFQNALNVPPGADGIETQFYLRPTQNVSDRDSGWSDFRLCSYESGSWMENSHGSIKVNHREGPIEVAPRVAMDDWAKDHRSVVESASFRCSKSADPKFFYEIMDRAGLGYGPTFQTVQSMRYSQDGDSISEIAVDLWTLKQSKEHIHEYVVHPSTLDGIMQAAFPSLSRGGENIIPTLVPARISECWISATGFDCPDSGTIQAYAKSEFRGYREAVSEIIATDVSNNQIIAVLTSFEEIAVGNIGALMVSREETRRLCFSVDQKPDVDFLVASSLLEYCQDKAASSSFPSEFYRDLKLLIFLFMSEILRHYPPEAAVGLPFHHQKYLRWIQSQVDRFENGGSSHMRSEWKLLSGSSGLLASLSERLSRTNALGRLASEIGRKMDAILSGDMDADDFMSQGSLLEGYYQEIHETTSGLRSVGRYIDALAHKRPQMRILETGAGSGANTSFFLKCLTAKTTDGVGTVRCSQYDFTDMSSKLLQKPQQRFSHYGGRVQFKVLDIDNDPSKQGFEDGGYDLVIASHVLHLTKDIGSSLRNIRKLLKIGGKLLIVEITEPDALIMRFIFGLSKAWWSSADPCKTSETTVPKQDWERLLVASGYSGVDMCAPDCTNEEYHESSCMISTAVCQESTPPTVPRTVILVESENLSHYDVPYQLQAYLYKIGAEECDIVCPEEAASMQNLEHTFCISLLELDHAFLADVSSEKFLALRTIFTSVTGVLWMTRGGGITPSNPTHWMVIGLGRALRSEFHNLKFVVLAFESESHMTLKYVQKMGEVYLRTLGSSLYEYEPEFVERNGRLCIDRLVEDESTSRQVAAKLAPQYRRRQSFSRGPPLKMTFSSPGMLDSMEFLEDDASSDPIAPDEIEIEVKASGVNFRDCLIALGRIASKTMGFECSGIVKRVGEHCTEYRSGDRVCASCSGTYQTYTRCKESLIMRIPDGMSFIEAAALPTTCTTIYYALHCVGRMQKGESILIHAAAGGTGQAAIQLSKLLGAKIFVTVGSNEKKKLIMDTYDIPEEHIFYSRNVSFAQGVKRITNGRGVDLCLNSLTGEALTKSWECMAPFGRFLEIGKKDILSRSKLPMFPFNNNVSFHAIDLSGALSLNPGLLREIRDRVMSLIFQGQLRVAEPLHVYGISEAESALRYLQSGKNAGKTVVELRGDNEVTARINTKPSYYFPPSASYVISGGFGGIGRDVARWMAKRGAKYLILLSRSGPKNEASQTLLKDLQEMDVHVEAPACNVAEFGALRSVLMGLQIRLPPIKGCINAAMNLQDTLFESMSHKQWASSLEPKVQGGWNLHSILPKGMDFFIMLSSIAGIAGSSAQSNYSAGNVYLDALVRHRIGIGEKAMSLDLGVMTDSGVLVENAKLRKFLTNTGYFTIVSPDELIAILDLHCDPGLELSSPTQSQVVVGIDIPANLKAKGVEIPAFMRRPLFRHFHLLGNRNILPVTNPSETRVNYSDSLSKSETVEQAATVVCSAIVEKLSKALELSPGDFDLGRVINSYGVDSLLAVELRNWFGAELHADVAVFDILGNATFEDLGMTVAEKSKFLPAYLKTAVSAK